MVKAGFDAFAHLRLRDHRPGNGDYTLQPGFGPHSDSSKRSFLFKHSEPNNERLSAVGPGSYTIPSCIGAGRSTRFATTSHISHDNEQSNAQSNINADINNNNINSSTAHATNKNNLTNNNEIKQLNEDKDNKDKNVGVISQYSMALCPQSPQYTLHGKLPSEWIVNPTGALGPGAYNVLESYQHVHNTTLGASFGAKLSEHESNATTVPGPGAYRLRRFGDVDEDDNNNNNDNNTTWHRKHKNTPVVSSQRIRSELLQCHEPTPGPGSYNDPTTIAHRIGKRKVALVNTSTFGMRNNTSNKMNNDTWYRRVSGPGAYNVENGWEVTERNKRHAPRFRPPPTLPTIHSSSSTSKSSSKKRNTDASVKLPYELHLPSDFDYNYKKGKTMSSRWRLPSTVGRNNQAIGPGSYNTEHDYCLSNRKAVSTCQFAAEPYEAHGNETDSAVKKEHSQSIHHNAEPHVDYYNVNYSAIMPRSPCALVMNGRDRELDNKDGLPGPGHYNPEYKVLDVHANRSTEFYKGDFTHHGGIVSTEESSALPKIGPGSYYNDHTIYSKSIAGDLSSSSSHHKSCTFGIRYPARALYQKCKPRDEFTNINVTYDDERSWESPEIKVKE